MKMNMATLAEYFPGFGEHGTDKLSWPLLALIDPVLLGEPSPLQTEFDVDIRPLSIHHRDVPKPAWPYLLDGSRLPGHMRERFAQRTLELARHEALAALSPDAPRPRPHCALLLSPLPLADLLDVLRRSALVVDASGHRRPLRYWDPRVAQHLTNAKFGWSFLLSGFCGHWWFIDACGNLCHHGKDASDDPDAAHRALKLDEPAQRWLEERWQLNACFERANARLQARIDPVFPALLESLQVARSLGLQADDQIAFAARRWQTGAPIEYAPRMRALLDAACTNNLSFRNLQADLDELDWQEIAAQARTASSGVAPREK